PRRRRRARERRDPQPGRHAAPARAGRPGRRASGRRRDRRRPARAPARPRRLEDGAPRAEPGVPREPARAARRRARGAGRRLPGDVNQGLVLRWVAALAEMAAFDAVPPALCRRILETFGARVRAAIDSSRDLILHPVPPPPRHDRLAWDALTTIFSFSVRGPD